MARDGEESTRESEAAGKAETADEEGVSSASEERPTRRGAVDIRTRDGDLIHHDDAFVRYGRDSLVVSTRADFDPAETDVYEHERLSWYEVRHPRS